MKLYLYKSQNYDSWSARLGNEEAGSYFMAVNFAKCGAPAKEKATVDAVDFFLATYKDRKGEVHPKIVIQDYDLLRDTPQRKEKK